VAGRGLSCIICADKGFARLEWRGGLTSPNDENSCDGLRLKVRFRVPMIHYELPQHITERQLTQLADEAAASARRRSHMLLHADHQDQVQRLLISLEPDGYVRPCTASSGR
jgi:hypothetical protein